MKRTILFAAFVVASFLGSMQASAVDSSKPRLLTISVNDKDQLIVDVSGIVSVARHRYLLNGSTLVSEVTVDTVGNNSLRFYCIGDVGGEVLSSSPVNTKDIEKEVNRHSKELKLGRKKGPAPLPSVKFPEGVYAHTIEFQLKDSVELNVLFKEISRAWEEIAEKTTKVNPSEEEKTPRTSPSE